MIDILRTEELSKDFSGVQALYRVDITVRRGTIHSLIGPNGSGKTTFFNVVTGLIPSTAGRIHFVDTDITNLKPYLRTKTGISRTFQIPQVIADMTCLENVMLGLHCRTNADLRGTLFRLPFTASRQEKEIRQKAMALLESVGISESSRRSARDLSWVEEQLLQLARALGTNPKILLLDEPTAGMGTSETDRIKRIIKEIQGRGVTIMLVAHDINLVMDVSDRVTVLCFGHKIAEGTSSEVRRDPKVLEAYLGEE